MTGDGSDENDLFGFIEDPSIQNGVGMRPKLLIIYYQNNKGLAIFGFLN